MRLSPGQKDSALVCVFRPCIFPGLIQEMKRSDTGGYRREHWRGGTVWFRKKKEKQMCDRKDRHSPDHLCSIVLKRCEPSSRTVDK